MSVESTKQATPEIGAVESTGTHKGAIYGGIWTKEHGGDGQPIWFLAGPKSMLMDHYNSAAWAAGEGGALLTRAQGNYLTTLKDKGGAFMEIFNRGNQFPAGYAWLAETDFSHPRHYAWCQRLSDGDQSGDDGNVPRDIELPVLCVVR